MTRCQRNHEQTRISFDYLRLSIDIDAPRALDLLRDIIFSIEACGGEVSCVCVVPAKFLAIVNRKIAQKIMQECDLPSERKFC
jgi:hypothetical protein